MTAPPRRALAMAVAAAAILVLARSLVYIVYRQSYFDSDQAIVGLMAKHLSEGRAWPLYFYGQTYLLGVDAWLSAVVFAVAGPSVAALHATLTLESLLATALFVLALSRDDRLPPAAAVVALLPFVLAPPVTASYFVDGAASAAPFMYIAFLWRLRERPLWFGVVAAVGFLHREFVLYGVLALGLLEAVDGALWHRARLRQWLIVCAAALATVQVVTALKPYADFLGPGTRGQLLRGTTGSNVGNLSERVDFVASELPARVVKMVVEHLPRVSGATFVDSPVATQGHAWLRWPCVLLLAAMALRVGWLRFSGIDARLLSSSPAAYLVLTGTIAAAGYVATRSLESAVDRYMLLVLLMPAGLVAWVLSADPSRMWRRAAAAFVLVLAVSSSFDHVRLAGRYARGEEPDDVQDLEVALRARGISVAMSGYWRAYKLSFLTNERIRVASSDFVRIEEYQRLAAEQGYSLLFLKDTPCGGESISPGWFLCRE